MLHLVGVSPPRGALRHHLDAVSFLARGHNESRGEIKVAIHKFKIVPSRSSKKFTYGLHDGPREKNLVFPRHIVSRNGMDRAKDKDPGKSRVPASLPQRSSAIL